MSNRRLMLSIGSRVLTVAALVVLWALAAKVGVPRFLPSPSSVAISLKENAGQLADDTVATLARSIPGLVIGTVVAIGVALLMDRSTFTRAAINPHIILYKHIPVIALIPVFILWFGLGNAQKVAFIALGSFFVVIVSATEALRNVPPVYELAASCLGASRGTVYRRVVLPAMLPDLVGGIRVAATLSFSLAVAAEFMGAETGLGAFIIQANLHIETDAMLAATLWIVVVAILIDWLARIGRSYVLRWA